MMKRTIGKCKGLVAGILTIVMLFTAAIPVLADEVVFGLNGAAQEVGLTTV